MGMLETLMGGARSGVGNAVSAVSDAVSKVSDTVGDVSDTVGDSFMDEMKSMESEAQTAILGVSHNELMGEMEQQKDSDYALDM